MVCLLLFLILGFCHTGCSVLYCTVQQCTVCVLLYDPTILHILLNCPLNTYLSFPTNMWVYCWQFHFLQPPTPLLIEKQCILLIMNFKLKTNLTPCFSLKTLPLQIQRIHSNTDTPWMWKTLVSRVPGSRPAIRGGQRVQMTPAQGPGGSMQRSMVDL